MSEFKVRILDTMEMIRKKGGGQMGLSVPNACRGPRHPRRSPSYAPLNLVLLLGWQIVGYGANWSCD